MGTIEPIQGGFVKVNLDNNSQRAAVDRRFYKDLDHGYAATGYKAQGSTADRSYLLATPHYDRHVTYVALSRHRESATVFYAAEDFGTAPETRAQQEKIRARLMNALSRARPKELVHDYLDREASTNLAAQSNARTHGPSITMDDIDARQQQAAARWREKERLREQGLQPGTGLQQDHTARQRWGRMLGSQRLSQKASIIPSGRRSMIWSDRSRH